MRSPRDLSWRQCRPCSRSASPFSCASGGGPAAGPPSSPSGWSRYFHRPGVTIAVAYRNLGTGATYLRNEDEIFHAASTMKLPVMMALFQAVDAGELRLDEPIAGAQPVPEPGRRLPLRARPQGGRRSRPLSGRRLHPAARGADPADDRPQLEPRDQPADREDRRLARHRPDAQPRRLPHPGAARRRGPEGLRGPPEQHRHGGGPGDRPRRPRRGHGLLSRPRAGRCSTSSRRRSSTRRSPPTCRRGP